MALSLAQLAAIGTACFNIALALIMLVQYARIKHHYETLNEQREKCSCQDALTEAYEYIQNLEKECEILRRQLAAQEGPSTTCTDEKTHFDTPSSLRLEVDPKEEEINEILYLSDRGKSSRDIAALLGKGVDEIELVLTLHKRNRQDNTLP